MLGWELPPHNSGGLGVACYQLCKALSKKGADIEFVLPYTADHSGISFMRVNSAYPQDVETVLKAGMAYDSFKYIKSTGEVQWIDIFGQASIYEEAVGRIVKLAEFDIIHAHDWLTCRAAIRAKMLTGKPLVVHFHSIEADRAGRPMGGNPFVREIENLALLIADKVIAVSQFTKDAIIREYGIPAEKIEVVHNHSDPNDLIPEEGGDNIYRYLAEMRKLGYRIITNVGRLTIQKGLPNLLRSFKIVLQHNPKTFLLIVGSGEQQHELIQQAADMGIAHNVFFAGFQRGKKCRDAYTVADLFVMPSISEPFGLTALEAIAYGTPVLISKQSGVSEMITNALKADFWDIDEMANKMVALVQNDALRDELHANSHREYMSHSWRESADKLFDIYNRHTTGATK
ncbi:MAG TPA: glycosyltransferase family 4 protein [Candidatus Saccharimonadales bacterium]|nr:glycosyltransferase family 4 protein [Candidatus Saccharimonadales bacterium]